MVGHCAGLRNHQEIGDLVLATGHMRDDRILDDVLPTSVPVSSNHFLNALLIEGMEARGLTYRMGTVFTTSNRNWEFNQERALAAIQASRSVAVDMESATVAANGFRYRIPTAALLCVSDKPLHGQPKLSAEAQTFYRQSRVTHLEVAAEALEKVRERFPGGLPASDIRSADEPLLGSG
jgi:AMP nucleosidase